jgi:hypothetical protein
VERDVFADARTPRGIREPSAPHVHGRVLVGGTGAQEGIVTPIAARSDAAPSALEILERTFKPVDHRASRPGVYILIRGSTVVYVGSSKSVSARVEAHGHSKCFDRAIWRMFTSRWNRWDCEGALIRALKPELNLYAGGSPFRIGEFLRKLGLPDTSAGWESRTKAGRRPGRLPGTKIVNGRAIAPDHTQ